MRRVIDGRVRNTERMETICGRWGNPNSCTSSFTYLLFDSSDNTYYAHTGYHWSGVGSDGLIAVADPLKFIERQEFKLTEAEADRIATLIVDPGSRLES